MSKKLQPSQDSQSPILKLIADAVEARGESILNENGVDRSVCELIADDIKKILRKHMVGHILIEVSGGVVTDVHSTIPSFYKIKDWDNINCGDAASYLEDIDEWIEAERPTKKNPFDKRVRAGVQEALGENKRSEK